MGYNTSRVPLGNAEDFKPDHTISYSIHSNTNFHFENLGVDCLGTLFVVSLRYFGDVVQSGEFVCDDNP